ncbi:MAG: hypothetical protein F6K39_45840 [Okeania sp. SIO3B3]|nr:hypothetical protein [Okeania sp. SIO3B3]
MSKKKLQFSKEEGTRKKEEGRRLLSKKKTSIFCRYSPLGLHKRFRSDMI